MLQGFLLQEAIHSTALACGCGRCLTCRAAGGDVEAYAEVWAKVQDELEARGEDDRR